MKKNFFYLAMAMCVAMCTLSCGSDDDDNGGGSTPQQYTYTKQKYADEATAFTIEEDHLISTTETSFGETASLTAINFTESGKAIFETTFKQTNGKKNVKYTTCDYDISGNTYTVKEDGKEIGTIVNNGTRAASEGVMITINLKLKIGGVEYPFITDTPVDAVHMLEGLAASDGLTNITRTWKVSRMVLTLRFDKGDDPSVKVDGGKLSKFQILAEDNGIILKEEDRTALNREILGITLDKQGLFTITYSDKYNDAANWTWQAGSNGGKINLRLKDEEMGNKFLENTTTIEAEYAGDNKINLYLTTRLESDKCTAIMILNLY